ncbi:FUSC family protein [Pararobbsia silviterrae]|uniref:FUSC family protein n=1 Tax=Pararobbsia silviterrae TaxID=1792498 RepID=A0A494YD97_9BURK|nr:FUSC family protein [Pararobbsia silviterrae]RKP58698.1 FUSC family protein [Pararobbsia silviterrae]
MTLPSTRDWIFSIKTFVAAMLALYIALASELPRPYWAMATVYIVSNPFVGATTSKALYRALGTLLGAAVSVLLVPPLVEMPFVLSLASALWIGVMLYLAMTDRTARSYVFLLAGYSLALIALPTVNAPEGIFDVAITRSEEIILGITCGAVVNSIVFPSKLAPVLGERTAAWFRDAAVYARETLAGRTAEKASTDSRQRMATMINSLEFLLSQLSYDGTRPDIVLQARELRARMSLLLPIISALSDPLRSLLAEPTREAATMRDVVERLSVWIEDTRRKPGSHADSTVRLVARELREEIASLEPPRETLEHWHAALLSTVLWRLKFMVDIWEDCVTLQHAISVDETRSWAPQFRHWRIGVVKPYFDYGMMLFSTLSTVLAVLVGSVLWIETGWVDGAGGVSLGAVACCFFAALDDPAPQVFRFFIASSISIVVAGVYLFVVLPNIHTFEMVVVAFAVPFICIGTLIPNPKFSQTAGVVAFSTATFISLQSAYEANFETFLNGNLSAEVGLLFAYLWVRVTRPFGAELSARRLTRSSWNDLVLAASPHALATQREMAARMLDRLLQLLPRLASTDAPDRLHPQVETFRDMRVGLNVLDLQVEREIADPRLHAAIDDVLVGVRAHFERCVEHNTRQIPPHSLLEAIDAALDRSIEPAARGEPAKVMHTLISLRLATFPDTPPPTSLRVAASPA